MRALKHREVLQLPSSGAGLESILVQHLLLQELNQTRWMKPKTRNDQGRDELLSTRKGKEQGRFLQLGRGWGMEDLGRPRPELGRAGMVDVQREFHKVMLHGVEKNTLLGLPGNSLRTRQSLGDLCDKHHEHTEEWPEREYPEQGQGHSMGIWVKGNGKKGETLETKSRCENCWNVQV